MERLELLERLGPLEPTCCDIEPLNFELPQSMNCRQDFDQLEMLELTSELL